MLHLKHFFRYALSSVASAVVDEGVFALLSFVLKSALSGFALTAVPAAVARLISSLFNFFINKKLVFREKGHTLKALLRYYLLAIPTALLQIGLSYGMFELLGIHASQTLLRAVVYALVMAVLFIFNFLMQQKWVFSGKETTQ